MLLLEGAAAGESKSSVALNGLLLGSASEHSRINYLSSSSDSRSRSSIDQRSGIWSRSEDDAEVHLAAVAHHRHVSPMPSVITETG